jgi:hypothetical protein
MRDDLQPDEKVETAKGEAMPQSRRTVRRCLDDDQDKEGCYDENPHKINR